MKYMTFNASCSYAGLANLLDWYGVDVEDRVIALKIELPYLFAREGRRYLSGPMLQGAEWFDLYLHPIGFTFIERRLERAEVCSFLKDHPPAMLGLHVTPESKHAVVYTGGGGGEYCFINNKRQDSTEPETLRLTESALLSRLDKTVVVGMLENIEPLPSALHDRLAGSPGVLLALQSEINDFCTQQQTPAAQAAALNDLFRPLLLDGVTMLELLEDTEPAASLRTVRAQLLPLIRAGRPAVLSESIDLSLLNASIRAYHDRIKQICLYHTQTGANP
jgi:hypothetical protein